MDLIIESDSTPSISPKAPEFIVDYAKSLSHFHRWFSQSILCKSADTTGHSVPSDIVISIDTNTILDCRFREIASVHDVMPQEEHLEVEHELAHSLAPHMTSLLAALALHKARVFEAESPLTTPVPKVALKGARCFAEPLTMSGLVVAPDCDRIAGVPLTDEVSAFASSRALRAYISDAIHLIRRNFSTLQALEIKYEHDSETEQEWLSIETKVSGEIDLILEHYDSYVKHFNRLVPWPERSLIRLNYEIG